MICRRRSSRWRCANVARPRAALSQIGDNAAPALSALIKALDDKDEQVIAHALAAITQLGPNALKQQSLASLITLRTKMPRLAFGRHTHLAKSGRRRSGHSSRRSIANRRTNAPGRQRHSPGSDPTHLPPSTGSFKSSATPIPGCVTKRHAPLATWDPNVYRRYWSHCRPGMPM